MKNRELCIERTKRCHAKDKAVVIAHYGGKCACCGESRVEFLTIDHINNDGPKHRAELTKGHESRFYSALIKHGFPACVQVLCMNCNWARRYGATCPHEKERQARGQRH